MLDDSLKQCLGTSGGKLTKTKGKQCLGTSGGKLTKTKGEVKFR